MYRLEYFGATETGRRPRNEDNFLIFRNKFGFLITVVADGMGGHKGGDTASKAIVKLVKKELKEVDFNGATETDIKRILLTAVRSFQKSLKEIGEKFPQYADMGSTLNMNLFIKNKVFTVNIGDSRTQSFIKKEIVKISEDHNLAALAEKDERYAHFKGQTNMLTSSLGPNKSTTADFFITELDARKGYILMSSDGIHNFISDISLMKIIKSSSKSLEDKVFATIRTAYDNGSNDNLTFIIIKYERV